MLSFSSVEEVRKFVAENDIEFISFFLSDIDGRLREVTIPAVYGECRRTGRLAAWQMSWRPGRPRRPHQFWDSDVAKWMEAAAHSLATHPDPDLARRLERLVARVAREAGMTTLLEHGVSKALHGVTSISEILRVAR